MALERTKPNGRIIGIDLIPAQPPKGVSTIQGNFLAPGVQNLVKEYLQEFASQPLTSRSSASKDTSDEGDVDDVAALIREQPSYIDAERAEPAYEWSQADLEEEGRLVDVSDESVQTRLGMLCVDVLSVGG